jgi:hypothetical protein
MDDGITLQINVAAVDVRYAHHVVPALARAHRAACREIILTVDACKPQKTRQTDPAVRCAEPQFTRDVEALRALGDRLVHDRIIDRVVPLEPGDPWLVEVTRKYSGRWIPETHDYGGRPITGYWAGIEAARTRYVVHYDGDMFLHQEAGFDWAAHAIPFLETQANAVSASPRLTAPFASKTVYGDGPSSHEGVPFASIDGGWKHFFFSTRVFLLDRRKFERYLPLGRGRILAEQLVVKAARRGFPRSAEKMYWVTVGAAGGYRLVLSTEKAWVLHPSWKPAHFAELVPAILDRVAQGRVPDAQLGQTELQLDAWREFLQAQ